MNDTNYFQLYPIPSWIYSVKTLRFLEVNDAAVSCYGYSRDQFLRMTLDDIRPVADRERLQHHLSMGACESGAPSIWRHCIKDGSCIDVEILSVPVVHQGEQARLVSARNVSGQTNNLERLNLALSVGKIAVWELNIADRTLTWNPGHAMVQGLQQSGVPATQSQFFEMVTPETRAVLSEALQKCLDEGGTCECEFQLQVPGSAPRWRHAMGQRIDDATGRPIKVIGVGIDVTERKSLEAQIRQTSKFEAVGRLASGIAHDFNNILTVIGGYAHLMLDESGTEIEGAAEIYAASERAARLVKQLLEFSRIKPVDPRPVELNEVLANSLTFLKRLIPANIGIAVELGTQTPTVLADPGQVEQLIMNLCLNARDAMPMGGTLGIRAWKSSTDAYLQISDTGCGMPESIKDRIFEPFFTTKEVGSGTGLGLSIVHGIVTQLKGSVEVVSKPGQGSSFSIRLPLFHG